MNKITLKDIKNIIVDVGLDAEFRKVSNNKWSDIINNGKDVPVVYMEHYVNYRTVVFNYLSKTSIEISLVLSHDNKPCAIWPLLFDTANKEPIKSIDNQYGGVVIPPLFVKNFPKKSQRKVVKSCIDFLNKLLIFSQGECWRTNELSMNRGLSQWHQIVLEKGCLLDKASYEMYLDLSMSLLETRKNFRKSYKPLISSGQKNWNVVVMDEYNEDIWNKFRELHKKVAGRVTRPVESWNIQHQAIKEGKAFLVYILNSDGIMIGGGYFDMSEFQCYYSVGSYDRKYIDQPIAHLIQYHAILTMKDKNRKMYYIGDRFYVENLPYVTNKQVDISHFKQGFSSIMFPRIGLISRPNE
jgi:FemAB family protein